MAAPTQTDLDALDSAIASSMRTVHYSDRTVTYGSIPEMLQARTALYLQLNPTLGSNGMIRQCRMWTQKGT